MASGELALTLLNVIVWTMPFQPAVILISISAFTGADLAKKTPGQFSPSDITSLSSREVQKQSTVSNKTSAYFMICRETIVFLF